MAALSCRRPVPGTTFSGAVDRNPFNFFIVKRYPVMLPVGSVLAQNMFVGGKEKTAGAAGRVEDGISLVRVHNLNDEVDDIARSAELAVLPLCAHAHQQVFKSVAQFFAVIITETVDDF